MAIGNVINCEKFKFTIIICSFSITLGVTTVQLNGMNTSILYILLSSLITLRNGIVFGSNIWNSIFKLIINEFSRLLIKGTVKQTLQDFLTPLFFRDTVY